MSVYDCVIVGINYGADNEIWIRKGNNANFDVGIGSYDSAQVADLVGLLILHSIAKIEGLHKIDCGLYRDDGLIAVPNATGPKIDRIRKNLIKILLELGFKLEVASNRNIKIVNFLDVMFNLNKNTYENYSKPNTNINYVRIHSNHPSSKLKCILCLEESLQILILKNKTRLLNKRSDISNKCRHKRPHSLAGT